MHLLSFWRKIGLKLSYKNRTCCFTVGEKGKQESEGFSRGTKIKNERNGT